MSKNPTYNQGGAKDAKGKGGAGSYKITSIKTKNKTYKATTKTVKEGKGKKKKPVTYLFIGGLRYDISGMNKKQLKALEKQIKTQLTSYEKMGVTPHTDKNGNLSLTNAKGISEEDLEKEKLQLDNTVSGYATKIINNYINVEGMPYQFMESVDPRYNLSTKSNSKESKYGRKYSEKIIARMPLVFFTPVKPIFMDDFNQSDVSTALQALVTGTGLDQDLLQGNGRYYSVKFDYTTYYRYLNMMLHAMAYYLDIGDETYIVPGTNTAKQIKKISWEKDNSDAFATFYSAAENVVFYADSLNQVTETFTNETMESSIASSINGFADQMKEIDQLVGGAAKKSKDMASEVLQNITKVLEPVVSKLGGGILGSLAEYGVDTVLNGGKIIFPKIWANSTHNTSYSINFKLRSPDHDTLSLYINILKPYAKLLALTLPRAINGNPNAYNAPFFVKVACKGMVNIDMGIISSISFTKGNECQWNDDGIPSEIDVSVEIEDLYTSVISMSGNNKDIFFKSAKSAKEMVQNTAYMDYLANLCGLNIAQMELGRKVYMWGYLTAGGVSGIFSSFKTRFDNAISGLIGNVYNVLS